MIYARLITGPLIFPHLVPLGWSLRLFSCVASREAAHRQSTVWLDDIFMDLYWGVAPKHHLTYSHFST